MSGKRWAALGIAAVLFFVSIAVSMMRTALSDDFQKSMEGFFNPATEKVIEAGNFMEKIAVLEVNGVIQDTGEEGALFPTGGYHHRTFMKNLNKAKEDPAVKGIIIRVNSPGGTVVESLQIHDKIVEIQEEAKKPVYISMGTVAASGGYYISAPAEKIFASPETITGSLGVISQSINFSGFAERYGISDDTITSGEYKDMRNPFREMTEEERAIEQEKVDLSYNRFVKVISEGRGIPEEQVREIADGRTYLGQQAKELNLIDEFGYFEDALAAMKKDKKLKDAQVIQYTSGSGFGSFFGVSALKLLSQEESQFLRFHELLNQQNIRIPMLMYPYGE